MNEQNNDGKIQAGRHIAHPQAWGVRETKSGDPQIYVKFDLGLTWFGSLKEGRAREITLESLVTMGFMGDDLSELVSNENALDKNKDVALVVEYEANQNGEPVPRIKWVNDVDGGMKGKMDATDAIKALKMLKVKGDLAHIRKEKGVSAESQPNVNVGKDDEPPF